MIETNIDIVCPAQSAVTIDDPSIDEEIKDRTTNVRDYQEKLLLSLNERASLLVNAERLELALNDATAMMCIAPSSPLGYLCAGNIHSLRGQCASAIKTYDDGLKQVPSTHTLYAQLGKARAAACDINNKRIDFISQLPFDVVVYHIIPRLLHRETIIALGNSCSYFDVSHTWRQRMALANGLEYEVGPVALSEDGYRRVDDLAPFMRSLKVIQIRKEILSKIAKRHSRRLELLKKLTIIESVSRGMSFLVTALRLLRNTLTDLDIEYGHHHPPRNRYKLCEIMDACPNLVSLRMQDGDLDMSSVTKTYPKLIKLMLHNSFNARYEGAMASLLHPFPQLRSLDFHPVSGSDMFPALDQHCPLLQHLFLSDRCVRFPDVVDTSERPGLHALSVVLHHGFGGSSDRAMLQYVVKHSGTIEALDITSVYGSRTFQEPLQQAISQPVTFEQLRRISYSFGPDGILLSLVLWIIQRSPHLESIETVAGPQQIRIMEELLSPAHAHLKRLGMRTGYSTSEGEQRLIQHHLQLGDQSNLTEIKICVDGNYLYGESSYLSLVPGLTQLTMLELFTESVSGFPSLNTFLSHLADGCPALEQLTMTSYSCPVYYSILDPMHDHRNLKCIVINSTEVRGEVASFSQLYQNLESLHLNLQHYNLQHIGYLQKAPFKFFFTPQTTRLH